MLNTSPVSYKIIDENEEEIKEIFYEPELVKFDKQDNDYEVEKIIKTRTRNKKNDYFIKWLGYPDSMNSWIPEENLKN